MFLHKTFKLKLSLSLKYIRLLNTKFSLEKVSLGGLMVKEADMTGWRCQGEGSPHWLLTRCQHQRHSTPDTQDQTYPRQLSHKKIFYQGLCLKNHFFTIYVFVEISFS